MLKDIASCKFAATLLYFAIPTTAIACYSEERGEWMIGCEPPNFAMPKSSGLRSFFYEKNRIQIHRDIACAPYKAIKDEACKSSFPSDTQILSEVSDYYSSDDYGEDLRQHYCYQNASNDHIRLAKGLLNDPTITLQSEIESQLLSPSRYDQDILTKIKTISGKKYSNYVTEFDAIASKLNQCIKNYVLNVDVESVRKVTDCKENSLGVCTEKSAFESISPSWQAFGPDVSKQDGGPAMPERLKQTVEPIDLIKSEYELTPDQFIRDVIIGNLVFNSKGSAMQSAYFRDALKSFESGETSYSHFWDAVKKEGVVGLAGEFAMTMAKRLTRFTRFFSDDIETATEYSASVLYDIENGSQQNKDITSKNPD